MEEEEAAEDQTERLQEGQGAGGELGGSQGGEVEGRVGVELLQGGLLVSPALLQPFLQPNVGVRQRAQRVTDKVKVDLQKQRKQRSQQGLQNRGQGLDPPERENFRPGESFRTEVLCPGTPWSRRTRRPGGSSPSFPW